ncbi:MAG: TIM barrel protein [Promethearchaeota archaeon]
MRFGITPIEVENILSVFDRDKGINSFLDFKFSDIILDAAERGYKHCEITLDLFQILPIPMNNNELARLKDIKKKYDLTYSAHFPIWSIELASPNKFIREASIQSLVDSYNILKGIEKDIETYILHPSGAFTAEITKADMAPNHKTFITKLFSNFAIQSIKKVIRETKIDKTKICIENIEFPFNGTLDIINKLKGTRLCIDTAHFLGGYSGDVDLLEITKQNLDITGEIHLQDFKAGEGADHAPLGKGKFPAEFLKIIYEYDFKGPIVFELTFKEAKQSLEYIEKYAPEIELPEIKS